MDDTQRMIAMLSQMRRQMNGAVAESMTERGVHYGLNYGVTIPTVRDIARRECRDHGFAKYLYSQQVRELRLAACHLAEPEAVSIEDFSFWSRGITTMELAEELAFGLLSHIAAIDSLVGIWCSESSELIAYCALMAAARSGRVEAGVAVLGIECALKRFRSSRIIGCGAVAVLSHLIDRDGEPAAEMTAALLDRMPPSETSQYIADEIGWRLSYRG
ncbi:MAG: DNA alkylation repair protein [Alistipes sp.]|nr:DNA alkylation repair protein [Alistipes sp.]MDE6862221.1 DNA alkylation repair protein [Alistipes sp.]